MSLFAGGWRAVVLSVAHVVVMLLATVPFALATWHCFPWIRRQLRTRGARWKGGVASVALLLLAVATYCLLGELRWGLRQFYWNNYLALLTCLAALALVGLLLAWRGVRLEGRRGTLLKGSLGVVAAGLLPLAALVWLSDLAGSPWPGLFWDFVCSSGPLVGVGVITAFAVLALILSWPLLRCRNALVTLLVAALALLVTGTLLLLVNC